MSWPARAMAPPDPGHDAHVLHGRPLRPGVLLEQTPRMRDDIWPLGAAVLQVQGPPKRLSFLLVPGPYRQAAKELAYAMLSGTPPAGEHRRSISTIRSVFTELQRLFTWLASQAAATGQPPPALAGLTAADLQAYQRHLTATLPTPRQQAFARASVGYLWRYRHALACDRLSFDPRHLDGWHQPRPGNPENTTDRIPESVLGPLLAWSLRFTRDFAPDILAADRQWQAYRDGRPGQGAPDGAAAARRALAGHLARRKPLPGRNGQVNIFALARASGCDRSVLDGLRAEVQAAAAAVGVTDWACYDLPVTGLLDAGPWIPGIAVDPRMPASLATLARLLQASCYVIIAFLSGMRDSEIKHLRRDCLQVSRDADGRAYRWKLTSRAFKGERDPAGAEATWVVGQPAAEAIEVLRQLQPADSDLLFAPLPHGPGAGPASRAANAAIVTATTNRQLNELAAWITGYCRDHDRSDGLPAASGQPFRLQTRQFRRTLAWFIARRPGGAIAGAIHYRHLSIQMFEGYAGTSASGFRAEVESEEALARGEHLLAVIDKHEHEDLAGPAADEAARRLGDFRERAGFRGIVVTDPRQLQRLMLRHDPAIYPGTYATCVFNPDKALCQRQHDTRGTARPTLGACRPLDCRNTALTAGNAAALRDEVTRIGQQLAARPALAPLLHSRLADRRDQITEFLARYPERP